jgi:hypothetical protein
MRSVSSSPSTQRVINWWLVSLACGCNSRIFSNPISQLDTAVSRCNQYPSANDVRNAQVCVSLIPSSANRISRPETPACTIEPMWSLLAKSITILLQISICTVLISVAICGDADRTAQYQRQVPITQQQQQQQQLFTLQQHTTTVRFEHSHNSRVAVAILP